LVKYFVFSVLGIISFFILTLVGMWAFYALIKINETVVTGEAYGFKIGDSKVACYQALNKLIANDKVMGFEYVNPKETYDFVYQPQKIEKIELLFPRWDYWVLTGVEDLQSDRVDFRFDHEILNDIRKVGGVNVVSLSTWPVTRLDKLEIIESGDSYQLVYEKLLALQERFPLIRIAAANLSTYKLPKHAYSNEYYLVKDYSNWRVRVSHHFFSNSITLYFDEYNNLSKVHRNRTAFELP
jgi:hypothetical protein